MLQLQFRLFQQIYTIYQLTKYYKEVIVLDSKPTLLSEYNSLVKCMYLTKYIASQKEKDQYVVLQIVIEMLARGYEFLPVDLEKSDWRIYKIEDGKIRLPFSAIDGIGETAAQAIAAAVERNPEGFVASDDLAGEPGVCKSVVDALRSAGALGNLPESKQIAFF